MTAPKSIYLTSALRRRAGSRACNSGGTPSSSRTPSVPPAWSGWRRDGSPENGPVPASPYSLTVIILRSPKLLIEVAQLEDCENFR